MTEQQQQLVQASWKSIETIGGMVPTLFYAKLFELDASTRLLFPSDTGEQGNKLRSMLTFAVNNIGHLAHLAPTIRELGRRHLADGVRDDHYAIMGAALLWTLARCLGPSCTDEVREAWVAAIIMVSDAMRHPAATAA